MHNWQENEIKELLTIRGSEAIRNQITGTVKDSVVYNRMTKLLAERGVYRSHMQVISKLKALRKQYAKYHQQKARCGSHRVDWPFYEQCHRVFGNAPAGSPAKRPRSPSTPPAPASSPPPPATSSAEHREVVVGLWDEVNDRDVNKHLGPVDAEDEEDQYSPAEHLHSINAKYTVPAKKRKTTVMQQVSALVSATVTQLREMDAAMQAQEDARLQRLMDHEREMQNNLMSELIAMHERISRENHERHLELVDRILSRFPSPSKPLGH
ncbi:uncharacterized protein LOC114438605 [Parambassis ranga]|uniref:Uncharacterized protein LOC114438605 n=1 Tax=Parambassis ranga TaxID=210632 RepID=A0A6P7IC70_9TELE|nr:uncharacterized protein LOC114438605 [Parambassis ranga]